MNKDIKCYIALNLVLPRKTMKALKIKKCKQLNGMYVYDHDAMIINLGSTDFLSCITDKEYIDMFTKVATHESVHKAIYEITNKIADIGEEHVTLILANQEDMI